MTLLDVSGSGLFSHSAVFFHALGSVLKLAAGSLMIVLLALTSFIGIVVFAIYKGIQTTSILHGAKALIHYTAYAIGVAVALLFALITGLFFSLTVAKLLFAALLIAVIVGFVVRETFLFLVLKRFGKYVLYLTALQRVKESIYNGEQENQSEVNH